MSDFDNYIKETYQRDYENLKLNYPDVSPSEFYPEAMGAWEYQQQNIDDLNNQLLMLQDVINEAIDFLNCSNANDEYYVLQAIKILKGELK